MEPQTSSVIENEADVDETKLTLEKVKLEDGTFNFVFSRIPNDDCQRSSQHWRCNICDVVVGGSLLKHALGRKHQISLSLPTHSVANWHKKSSVSKSGIGMKLAPGEPVPPGFEDEVKGVTEIQASLDSYHSGPLIGLGYLVELSVYEDEREPQYICLLCDKRGDPRTVMAHLVSFNHRITYLMTHFPTAYRTLNPYTKQYRRTVLNVVNSICEHIEKRYGRMIPQVADKETFERKRQQYMDNVSRDNHPSERMGDTFEHLIDIDAITKVTNDPLAEIKKADEEVLKGRNYRKTGSVPGCKDNENVKRDPSPPVVAAPEIKTKSAAKIERDRKSLSSISSISSSSLSSPPSRTRSKSRSRSRSQSHSTTQRYVRKNRFQDFVRRSRSRSPGQRRFYRRASRSRSRSPYPRFKHDSYAPPPSSSFYMERLPWQRSDYARSRTHYLDRKAESSTKMELNRMNRLNDYKRQCEEIEEDMAKILEQHERNPEKHPMYPEEWKKFWNRRYKELQAENKDPSKHDFKPEWIDYWNKRMKEMHDGEVKQKKDSLRKRLNLPEEPSPISFKISNKKKSGAKSPERSTADTSSKNYESDVIVIEDSKDDECKERERERDRDRDRDRNRERDSERERKRSHSPWESDVPLRYIERNDYQRNYYKPKQMYQPRKVKQLSPQPQEPETDTTDLNIIAVLRLLTALEEKLGSLGPKVIEMLSQALALEKAEANSADTLLDNEINCVLFETVKEKLKGQLLAGMVEASAKKTFKNSIQKIASLLHYASERKKEQEKELQSKIAEPVKIPGIGAIDKGAIAKQIATALVVQGKTDVTQAELEQLINAVVGMAQASEATGKTVSTASFVQQMNNPQQTNFSGLFDSAKTTSNIFQMLKNDSFSSNRTASGTAMDSLSDSELKTLLQNFKDLSTDEQHSLITYLKKLEAKEPERVERLRKFVKLGPVSNVEKEMSSTSGRISPFSNREAGVNPSVDELIKNPVSTSIPFNISNIDSDEDEDYSYEDVFRAASKNIEDSKKLKETSVNLTDTKMLIANLMGQLGKRTNTGINPVPNIQTSAQKPPEATVTNVPVISGDNNSQNYGNVSYPTNTNPVGNYAQPQMQYPIQTHIQYPNQAQNKYPYYQNTGGMNQNLNPNSNQNPNPNQNPNSNPNLAPDYNNAYNPDYGNGYGQSTGVPPQYGRPTGQSFQQPYGHQNYY